MTTRTHKHGNNYHETTKRLIGLSENTLGRLDETVGTLKSQSKRYSQRMEKYIQQHPSRSIGLAVLAGFGLAVLLRGLFK